MHDFYFFCKSCAGISFHICPAPTPPPPPPSLKIKWSVPKPRAFLGPVTQSVSLPRCGKSMFESLYSNLGFSFPVYNLTLVKNRRPYLHKLLNALYVRKEARCLSSCHCRHYGGKIGRLDMQNTVAKKSTPTSLLHRFIVTV